MGRPRSDKDSHLFLLRVSTVSTVIGTLATVAGVVVALVISDTIEITRAGDSGKTVTAPPRTVVETVRETVTVTAPVGAEPSPEACSKEPNEDRRAATPIGLGSCEAAIETVNDRDWFVFESSAGGQFELTVQKEEGAVEFGTIIVSVYEGSTEIEGEHVAADEPLIVPYTLDPGAELGIELIDGCGPPGGCGLDGYTIELNALG